MRLADLELLGGFSAVDFPGVKLFKDVLEKQTCQAFGQLFFSQSRMNPDLSLGRGSSSASATLRPPQALDQETVPTATSPVPF